MDAYERWSGQESNNGPTLLLVCWGKKDTTFWMDRHTHTNTHICYEGLMNRTEWKWNGSVHCIMVTYENKRVLPSGKQPKNERKKEAHINTIKPTPCYTQTDRERDSWHICIVDKRFTDNFRFYYLHRWLTDDATRPSVHTTTTTTTTTAIVNCRWLSFSS